MKDKLIFEATVEVGPKGYKVYRERGNFENTSRGGAYNYSSEQVQPSQNDAIMIDKVIAYLKKAGKLNKIASKEDTKTMDINFNVNTVDINFDDGGSMKIPIKKVASVVTESKYFNY